MIDNVNVKVKVENQANRSLKILPNSAWGTVVKDVCVLERNHELITPGTLNIVSDISPDVVTSLVNLFNTYRHFCSSKDCRQCACNV